MKARNATPRIGKLNGALQRLQEVSAKLSYAWKFGGNCWKTLATCVKSTCAYVVSNAELNKLDELYAKVNSHLIEVDKLAGAAGL